MKKRAQEANQRLADARAIDAKQKAAAAASAASAKLAAEAEAAKAKLAAEAEAAKKNAVIAEHKVGPDQTLSHIALKYYGSAAEPFWRLIYEANKEVIGANPGMIRPGMMLKIPVLPDELKK